MLKFTLRLVQYMERSDYLDQDDSEQLTAIQYVMKNNFSLRGQKLYVVAYEN